MRNLFYLFIFAVAIFSSVGFSYHNAYAVPITFQGWIGNCISGTNCDTTNQVTTDFCSDCIITGSSGSGNGQFSTPIGIAFDSSGNFFVSDYANNRIEKFNSAGVYQSQFGSGGSGNGQFSYPIGIALDSTGNIYVADAQNNRIQKFNSAGVYLSQFGSYGSGNGQFYEPFSIALDSAGNIYVSDYYNNRVEKFNSAGVYLSQFGSSGSGNGQFQHIDFIALDSAGNIYVTDANNNRIQKFNSAGVYLSQFGSSGSGNGQFENPEGIAFDSAGNIYVSDYHNNRVEKFNSAGVYQSQFGSYGSSNGQFSGSQSIALDSLGNIYVADGLNNRVEKFTPICLSCNTSITLNSISSVSWGNKITVSGQMVDQFIRDVSGATISFNGTGGSSITNVTTDVNGMFTTTGTTPNTVQTGWTVQAHFAGNSTLNPSNSNIVTYSTTSHHTSLSLAQPPNARWGQPTNFVATLLDTDNGGIGISGNSIHFNGTGVIGVADANTKSNGIATGHGTAPTTVKPSWTAEATFTPTGNLYIGSNSSTLKYNTLKHTTSLTMIIKPDPIHHNAGYTISGILKDLTTSTGLSVKTIQFVTNNSAIVIPSILTNSTGGYAINGLVAPNLAGKSVQIQATYSTQALYAGTAVLKLLKIT